MLAPGVLVDLEKVEVVMSWERLNVNLRDTKFLWICWILQEIREWAEVVHSRQDYRISPMGHGLHGWGGPDHREREIEILGTLGIRVLVTRGRTSFLLVQGRGRRLLHHTSFRTRVRIEHKGRDCPRDRDPKTLEQCSPS